MPVYVDPAINPWKGKMWCHLTADTEDELHEFATKKLKLKREWFQSKSLVPHYDITANKRAIAIQKGAIELSYAEAGRRVHGYRKQKLKERTESVGSE